MSTNEFPPHFRLMLLAAGNAAAPEELQAAIAATTEAGDWQGFLAATFCHRLAPMVLRSLKTPGLTSVPATVIDTLEKHVSRNRRSVMQTALRMKILLGEFSAKGFEARVLKGLPLSRRLYGDAGLRHCGDVDLLTDEKDLPGKMKLMRELGYRLIDPEAPLTPRRLRTHARYWKSATLVHGKDGVAVDLHWRLFSNRTHPANRISAERRSEALEIYGAAVSALTADDEFVYLAAHGAADEWIYLKSLADLSAAVQRCAPEEMETYLERAAELGLMKQTSSAVRLAGEWFGSPCDHPLLLPASDAFHVALRGKVMARLRAHDYRPRRMAQGPLPALRSELAQTPGWRSAREIAGRYVWRPRLWSLIDLPDRWFWLYPVLGLLLPPRAARRRKKAKFVEGRGVEV